MQHDMNIPRINYKESAYHIMIGSHYTSGGWAISFQRKYKANETNEAMISHETDITIPYTSQWFNINMQYALFNLFSC